MKKKLVGIFVCMTLLITVFQVTGIVFAGENGPEIEDKSGDAFGYLDIDSVWFEEDIDNPDYLFVSMKINKPSKYKLQQTFAVFWKYDGKQYACGLHLNFIPGPWEKYSAGEYDNNAPGGGPLYDDAEGSYSTDTGIITLKIRKDSIGNPQEGEILTETWSNAFRRVGLLGRLGFTRTYIDMFILNVFGNSMWDYAPDNLGEFGLDYIIQY